jgi:hypothetical protein
MPAKRSNESEELVHCRNSILVHIKHIYNIFTSLIKIDKFATASQRKHSIRRCVEMNVQREHVTHPHKRRGRHGKFFCSIPFYQCLRPYETCLYTLLLTVHALGRTGLSNTLSGYWHPNSYESRFSKLVRETSARYPRKTLAEELPGCIPRNSYAL